MDRETRSSTSGSGRASWERSSDFTYRRQVSQASTRTEGCASLVNEGSFSRILLEAGRAQDAVESELEPAEAADEEARGPFALRAAAAAGDRRRAPAERAAPVPVDPMGRDVPGAKHLDVRAQHRSREIVLGGRTVVAPEDHEPRLRGRFVLGGAGTSVLREGGRALCRGEPGHLVQASHHPLEVHVEVARQRSGRVGGLEGGGERPLRPEEAGGERQRLRRGRRDAGQGLGPRGTLFENGGRSGAISCGERHP